MDSNSSHVSEGSDDLTEVLEASFRQTKAFVLWADDNSNCKHFERDWEQHEAMTLSLQAFRFGLYVSLPILATVVYTDPDMMHRIVTRLNYIIYPPEGERPPVGDEIFKYRRNAK